MPDPIPLQDAVAKGLIQCSTCGASGAGVREVGGKKHFLCEACVRRSRAWRGGIAALSVIVAVVLVVLIAKAGARSPGNPGEDSREVATVRTIRKLIDDQQPRKALALLRPALEEWPRIADLQFYQGRALADLGYEEAAVPFFRTFAGVVGKEPEAEECFLWLGRALARMDRAEEARAVLEREFRNSASRSLLADCYLELSRNEEALKALEGFPPNPEVLRIRYRALMALGRAAEAEKELDAFADPAAAAFKANLRAAAQREAGDFAAALKTVEAALVAAPGGLWLHLKRSEATVHLEAGDSARAAVAAQDLVVRGSDAFLGEGLWALVMAHLQAGEREPAVAAAREFHSRTDPQLSALRQQRLMIRHLLGELKDADLEAEAKAVSRIRANDLYYYLALATGRKEWAEKGLQATPGHNFPYHALRRLLGK